MSVCLCVYHVDHPNFFVIFTDMKRSDVVKLLSRPNVGNMLTKIKLYLQSTRNHGEDNQNGMLTWKERENRNVVSSD